MVATAGTNLAQAHSGAAIAWTICKAEIALAKVRQREAISERERDALGSVCALLASLNEASEEELTNLSPQVRAQAASSSFRSGVGERRLAHVFAGRARQSRRVPGLAEARRDFSSIIDSLDRPHEQIALDLVERTLATCDLLLRSITAETQPG